MKRYSRIRRTVIAALLFPSFAYPYNSALGPSGRVEAAVNDLGKKPDALNYLQEQAQENNPLALFYLGVASETGNGVQKDTRAAFEFYRGAADRIKEAAFNAGRLLYLGKRVDDAMSYFVVAAGADRADGIERAMIMLGRIYERGESSYGRNYIAAARWYEAAARRKEPFAIGKMGEFLLYGFGRSANKRDARIYIERAADMWNADSQFLMGEIFAKGMIGPVNRTEAGKWFFVAASHSSNHNNQAAIYLAALTDQELTSARRMADLWISAHPKAPLVDYSALIERVR